MARLDDVITQTTIRSVWGNTLRDQAVTQYATVAERDAKTSVTPDGSLCTVTATGIVYVKWSGTWRNILPTPPLLPLLLVGNVNAGGGVMGGGMPQATYGTCATPVGYTSAWAEYHVYVAPQTSEPASVEL